MSVARLLLLFSLMRKDQILGLLSSSGPSNISSISRKFGSHLLKFAEFRQVSLTGQRELTTSQTGMSDSSASSILSTSEHVSGLKFDNRNLRELPVDKETRTFPRQVQNAVSSRCKPTPVQSPAFIACSVDALKLLGINIASSQEGTRPSSLDKGTLRMLETYFSGNELLPGSETSAHCYCGHQFGNFAGQLGDGAAISLGEIVNEGQRWELQLKGAGLTPFSRTADGRKVLRSSVREFLCSEAMHYLNIPTTRAATLITSASTVQRDPFYDGGVLDEKCTIVSRIAPNFFRFGSFEIFKSDGSRKGPSAGNAALKKQLLDHVLTYYPKINKSDLDQSERYAAFYTEIVRRTAMLVARKRLQIFMCVYHVYHACILFTHLTMTLYRLLQMASCRLRTWCTEHRQHEYHGTDY